MTQLRIRAGDIVIELEWETDPGPVPPGLRSEERSDRATREGGTSGAPGPARAEASAGGSAPARAEASAIDTAPARAEPSAGIAARACGTATGLVDICAPTVGTFYRAPEPGAAPFVVEGDHVRRGQQVGIVEAMKLMIPLEAERDGHVVAVLAEDGTPVEYGDPLIAFAPAAG